MQINREVWIMSIDLEKVFGIQDRYTESVDRRRIDPADAAQAVRAAVGSDPVFAIEEDGKQIQIFAPDSALLQTVRMALKDANYARIQAASDVLGFEYIP